MKHNYKIKAFLLTVLIQIAVGMIVFFGGILDPLLGLASVAIYIFIIAFYLTYNYLLTSMYSP